MMHVVCISSILRWQNKKKETLIPLWVILNDSDFSIAMTLISEKEMKKILKKMRRKNEMWSSN